MVIRPEPGSGRSLLVAAYAVLAIAAGARSGVQLAERFSEAPLPYALSAVAAAVYLVAAVALRRDGDTARRVAIVACSCELTGVLVVGTLSLLHPAEFPDQTVWSGYGIGYGLVPLVLPVFGLLWLRRAERGPVNRQAAGDNPVGATDSGRRQSGM